MSGVANNSYLTATDAGGNTSEFSPNNLVSTAADVAAPTVKPPVQGLVLNPTLGTSAIPVKLDWSATDSASGVARYELQQSANGGAFAAVPLSSATAITTTLSLEPGNTYLFQVRTQDNAGNWSAWPQGPSFAVNVLQESHSAIGFLGTWSAESLTGAYGGSVKHTSAAGNSAKLTFSESRNVAWISPKGPNRGLAESWVDGAKVGTTYNLYSSAASARRVILVKNGMNSTQPHNIEVRALGTKGTASSGTRVDVDALVVLGAPQ